MSEEYIPALGKRNRLREMVHAHLLAALGGLLLWQFLAPHYQKFGQRSNRSTDGKSPF